MSDEKSDADEIEELIRDYGSDSLAYGVTGRDEHIHWLRAAKEMLKSKIKSIITERDALSSAARSHR